MKQATPGKPSYRKAVSWSVVMVAGQQFVTAGVAFVLAAVLGPSAFGTVAMATVFILFMQMLLQQAMPAIIQRRDLDPEHLDSAFWLVMGATAVISVLSIALSGPWAAINRTPDLQPIIIALSLLVPLQGLTVVQEAIFRRSMDFRSLAMRSLLAAGVGGVVGIAMAFGGAGSWALVGQQLATGVVQAVVVWSVSGWRPRLRFSRGHAHDLVGFSTGSSLASLAAFINVRSDALLIGLFFGPFAVGLYRLSSRFTEVFVDFLTRSMQQVAFPELSLLQGDPQAFARRKRDIMRQSSLLTLPALGILAGCAGPLLRLFGPEWAGAAGALQLLCVAAGVRALGLISAAGLQAIGRPHVLATIAWVAAGVSAGALVAVGLPLRDVASTDQVMGMAASRALTYLAIIGPIQMAASTRYCGLPTRQFLSAIQGPALAGIAAAAAGELWTSSHLDAGWPPLLAVAVTGTLSGSVALGLLAVVNRPALLRAIRLAERVVGTPSWAPGAYKPRHIRAAQAAIVGQALTPDPSGLDDYQARHVAGRSRFQVGYEPERSPRGAEAAYNGDGHVLPPRARLPESTAVVTDVGGRTGGRPQVGAGGSQRPDVSRGASTVDLWSSLGVIIRRWKVTVPMVVLTAVASLLLGGWIAPSYEASTTLLLVGPAGPNAANTTTTTAAVDPAAGAPPTTAAPPATPPPTTAAPPAGTPGASTTTPVTEVDPNPLLSLNQSLNSTARATLESITDDSVRRRLSDAGLSTDYEVIVAIRDPIMELIVTADDSDQALQTLGALEGAVVDSLQARQDQAGAPAQSRIQVQTLSETNQPRAIYASRRRAQLIIVALGLALTAVAAFGVERVAQRRGRRVGSGSSGGAHWASSPPAGEPAERRLVPAFGRRGDGPGGTNSGSTNGGHYVRPADPVPEAPDGGHREHEADSLSFHRPPSPYQHGDDDGSRSNDGNWR